MKNVLKILWKVIIKNLLYLALRWVYNYVDKDKDGYWSEEEIKEAAKELHDLYKLLKHN